MIEKIGIRKILWPLGEVAVASRTPDECARRMCAILLRSAVVPVLPLLRAERAIVADIFHGRSQV